MFATRTHFDYHNPAAVADLQQWLAEAGLRAAQHSRADRRQLHRRTLERPLSLASADPDARAHAVGEAEQALHIARRIPAPVLVAHLGVPRTQHGLRTAATRGPPRGAASRNCCGWRSRSACRSRVEVIPNELSRAGSLVHFVEDDLDGVGICLDFGHAHLDGDVVDAIETVSEHLIATHVHDNRGRTDDHLLPFEGTIDWPAALTAVQKVGYDGPFMFEIAPQGSTKDTLARARRRASGWNDHG